MKSIIIYYDKKNENKTKPSCSVFLNCVPHSKDLLHSSFIFSFLDVRVDMI